MSIRVRVDGEWERSDFPKAYVNGQWLPIARAMIYTGGTWERFFPDVEPTMTVITGGLTGTITLGVPKVVSGTTTAALGAIVGGTVTIYQRNVGEGDAGWVAVGSALVPTGAQNSNWSVSMTPTKCGASDFKAVYGGTPTNLASESGPSAASVIIGAGGALTGSALTNTSATLSWAAVPGALQYEVQRDSVLVSTQAGTTFNDSGLTPGTTYQWRVRALGPNGCVGAWSPVKSGTTGQDQQNDTGSATIEVRPDKTNSYRPDVGWGYIGENIGQGYYSQSGRNYTGVMDFGTNAELEAKVIAALGANGATRYANMSVSAARVYLFKRTGVGSGGSVTASFFNSTAAAGVGGAPPRNGTVVNDATASGGSGKWQNIGTAHWDALKAGTARSIVTYNLGTTNYAQFDGKSSGTNRGNLQLDCSWDYELTVAIPPSWNN